MEGSQTYNVETIHITFKFKIPDESLDMWIKQLEFYYNELMKKKESDKVNFKLFNMELYHQFEDKLKYGILSNERREMVKILSKPRNNLKKPKLPIHYHFSMFKLLPKTT